MMGVWRNELGMNAGARGFKGRGAGKGVRGADDLEQDRTGIDLDGFNILGSYLLSMKEMGVLRPVIW